MASGLKDLAGANGSHEDSRRSAFGFYWIKETRRSVAKEDGYGDQADESERPGVIVSNHISYLDILYYMSSSFPSFVVKRSVARLPLVGLISKCLGCVYVH